MNPEWDSKEEVFLVVTHVTVTTSLDEAEILAKGVAEQRGHATVIKVPHDWDEYALTYENQGVVVYAGDELAGRAARARSWRDAL